MHRLISLFFIFFFFYSENYSQDVLNTSKYDSILKYRRLGDSNKESMDARYKYAKKAVEYSKETKVDSIILRSNRILSTVYLFSENYNSFRDINFQNLRLSKKIGDTLSIAIANHNLGWFHYQSRIQNDSAYYYYSNAVKLYNDLEDNIRLVEVLTNLSDIQQLEKDYLGSQESAIEGLKLLEKMPKNEGNYESAWIFNNNIGIISLELKEYEKSIDYNQKAIEITKKMNDGVYDNLISQNNLAFVYREKGDIKTALKLYQDVINNNDVFEIDPTFYALIINNIAFTRFLDNDTNYDELEQIFKRAYKICDSLNDPITKMASTIDMSKFFIAQNKIDSSLKYAKETYKLARETSSNDFKLESLMVLSKIIEGEEGKKYLNEYIKLSDSLLFHERSIRNKFARIKFETDKIELENQRISREKMWLSLVSVGLLITLFLLYIIITQRAKNKELKFKQDQQEANEEIYNLMLSQQDKVDEARAGEKKRISEELHDGILGRLFGTRLSLDSYNFSDGKEAMLTRANYINELKNIEQDIRQVSHDLNTDFVSGSGFMDIISELIINQTEAYQLQYKFDHTDDINWETIPNKTKINIYRIIQESLQNIYKHAEAKEVKISIQLKNDVICVSISDDGKGFEINKSKKGIGLKNINSRIAELEGNVTFNSEVNKGTTVTIEIPYSN